MSDFLQATELPIEVAAAVPEIVYEAEEAAFGVIARSLAALGYPVTGDVAPDEAVRLDDLFRSFVHAMALNNDAIAKLNEEES